MLDAVLDSGHRRSPLYGDPSRRSWPLVRGRSKYSSNDAGATLQSIKCDLEQILRLPPLARVLMTLVQGGDVADHRYNSYIEDAGENGKLEDDIAAALGDIERLAESRSLIFNVLKKKPIYVLDDVLLPSSCRCSSSRGSSA